jgi:hypothetical protein
MHGTEAAARAIACWSERASFGALIGEQGEGGRSCCDSEIISSLGSLLCVTACKGCSIGDEWGLNEA